jgi:FG-GAP-like repeat/Putative Ig domain
MRSRSCALFVVVAIAAFMGGCSQSPPISVNLTPASSQAIDQGQTVGITANVSNATANPGVTWSLNGPGSISATSGSTISYSPPTASLSGPQQVTVTATSVMDPSKSAALQITVNPYLQIPFQSLASGTVGTAYSQTIQLAGGTAPFQWSVYDGPIDTGWRVGGAVPDGLTLNGSTGVVSGTPTGGGTWYFEATVTDATGAIAVNGFLSVQINPISAAANPIPFLNQTLVPTAITPGSPDSSLNVSGAGFVSGATINFNNTPLATTFVDGDHLSGVLPTGMIAAAGTSLITVTNPAPGGGRSNGVYFQVGAPAATVNFANATNSPFTVSEPWSVAIADFNEDGKPDLAITGNIRVNVMLGKGDGTFAPASGSPVSVPSPPYDDGSSPYTGTALAVGDFNRSGHIGLAAGLFENLSAAIFFGNGDGTFGYSDTLAYTQGQPSTWLTAADFNRDGNLDLFSIGGLNGVSPVTMLGFGTGAFNGVSQNFEIIGNTSAAGDFNNDGMLDVTVDGTNILLGNGDGTFHQGTSVAYSGPVTVSDFNGDGKLDLAICNGQGNNVTILLGDGTGLFRIANASPVAVGTQPVTMVAADFNNDGKQDLAVANFGDGTVTLLLGNGDGTFTPSSGSPYTVGAGPYGISAADFNGDGKLDLAVVNLTDGTVSILLQQ